MIWLRNALIAAIAVVSFLLFLEWNKFQEKHQVEITSSEETLPSEIKSVPTIIDEEFAQPSQTLDSSEEKPSSDELPAEKLSSVSAKLISVTTDTLNILIDTHGGDFVKVALPRFAQKQGSDDAFLLLNRSSAHTYIARSGLIGPNGTAKGSERALYSTSQDSYSLKEGEDTLIVDLLYEKDDIKITKRFSFERDSYIVNVEFIVENRSSTIWAANLFGQIKRDNFKPPANTGPGISPFVGAAITTDEKNFEKYSFSDLDDNKVNTIKVGGWVAMLQHYFISAWVPNPDSKNQFELRKLKSQGMYVFDFTSQRTTIEPNSSGTISAQFYAGPKNIRVLEKLSPNLDHTVDYGWLWFIAKPLFFGLDKIHSFVGNWGVAIILLTLLIKLVFFYPSAMSYRSMAKMRKVQPMMTELKERFGDDRQKMSMELMKLYKKEKVNPLGGCLPMLLQMPVFISLYWMIMESVELRHSPFYFWITDLSVKDPFFVLPLIMGATMWFQQRLNPMPPDPMQAKVMQMMPFIFTAMFLFFPSGLVLYWVVNNTLSIAQQWFITYQIEKEGK